MQIASVGWLWSRYAIDELHDGDAVGVDTQLYWLACAMQVPHIVIHPPVNIKFRSGCGLDEAFRPSTVTVTIRELKGYHARDRDVVDESQAMVGCPKQALPEEMWADATGGTWYTINYTLEVKKPLAIVWPNGHITYRNWNLVKL